tara:strand:+ start:4345 stop:5652 length:1308 start_codon:yes stop_codon:yes gene_type:complete
MRNKLWSVIIACFISLTLGAQWCGTTTSNDLPHPSIQSKNLVEDIVIPVVFYIFDNDPDPKIQIDYSLADLQYQLKWLNHEFEQVHANNPRQSIRFCIASADANLPLPIPQATDIAYVEQVVVPQQRNALGQTKKMGIFYIDRDPTANGFLNDQYIQQMTGLDHQKYLIVVIAEAAQHGNAASYATDIHGWQNYSSRYQHVVLIHQHLHIKPGMLNEGDVLVHEVGHYLGLAHVFEAYCQGQGDKIQDTPPYATSAMSTNCAHSTSDECIGLKNKYPATRDNHMDYKGDYCRQSFSPQQTARMVATCNQYLNPLISAQNLQAAEIICDLNFGPFPKEKVWPQSQNKMALNEQQSAIADLYPNPANEAVQIELRKVIIGDELRLEVLEASGRSLKLIRLNPAERSFSLDLSYLPQGSYWIRLSSQNHYETFRLMKL